MGVYMGIFNFTIAGPQIISGLLGSFIIGLCNSQAIYVMVICGVSMILGGLSVSNKNKDKI